MTSEERKAENEVIFRRANEQIASARDQLPAVTGPTPFICECSDEECRETVLLTPEQYEAVRAHPRRFVLADGHPSSDEATVVEQGDGYSVVEKSGRAGEIATESDPRAKGV